MSLGLGDINREALTSLMTTLTQEFRNDEAALIKGVLDVETQLCSFAERLLKAATDAVALERNMLLDGIRQERIALVADLNAVLNRLHGATFTSAPIQPGIYLKDGKQ